MTRSSQSPKNLRLRQQRAVDLLSLGRTDAEVAEQVGTTRITVAEWRLYDPVFAAALNGKREQPRSQAAASLAYPSTSIGGSSAFDGVSESGVGAP